MATLSETVLDIQNLLHECWVNLSCMTIINGERTYTPGKDMYQNYTGQHNLQNLAQALKDIGTDFEVTVPAKYQNSYVFDGDFGAIKNTIGAIWPVKAMKQILTEVNLSSVTTYNASLKGYNHLKVLKLDSVKSVKSSFLKDVTSLETVSLPACTTVGNSAFAVSKGKSSSLKTLSLPSATKLGNSVFSRCNSLTNVNVSNVKTVGSSAFFGCSRLTKLELPKLVTLSNSGPFNSSGIQDLTLYGSATVKYNQSASTFKNAKSLRSLKIGVGFSTKTLYIKIVNFDGYKPGEGNQYLTVDITECSGVPKCSNIWTYREVKNSANKTVKYTVAVKLKLRAAQMEYINNKKTKSGYKTYHTLRDAGKIYFDVV